MSIHYHFVWEPRGSGAETSAKPEVPRLTSAFDTSLISNGKPEVQET